MTTTTMRVRTMMMMMRADSGSLNEGALDNVVVDDVVVSLATTTLQQLQATPTTR